MKLSYDLVINQLEGHPFMVPAPGQKIHPHTGLLPDGKEPVLRQLTLRLAIMEACSRFIQGDEQLDPLAKAKVGEIGMGAHKGLPLTSEQITTVKSRVAKSFDSPVLVYLLHEALESPAAK